MSDEYTKKAQAILEKITENQRQYWRLIAERYFTLLDSLCLRGFAGMADPPMGAAIDAWIRARAAASQPA